VVLLTHSASATPELSDNKHKSLNDSYQSGYIYSYDFSSDKQLEDWKIEGVGLASVVNGQLILEPEFHQPMMRLYQQGKFSNKNSAKEYGQYLAAEVATKYPDINSNLYVNGIFRGGHFNIWNKHSTPENYAISFDFKSLSSQALHMIMFSSQGFNGEDVLTGGLKPRIGLAQEIMHGDLHQYRISYFFPWRKTANMRKAPGRKMSAQGRDFSSEMPEKTHTMVITKYQGEINYFVNGQHALYYSDDSPFSGGNWGFRLMVLAKGAYDNIKVYQLNQDPVNSTSDKK